MAAIYDGWSLPIMLEKVQACYQDSTARLGTTAYFSKFIKYLTGIDSTESDNFWRSRLSDATTLKFPPLPHPAYKVHATSLESHVAHISREPGSEITLPSMIRSAWALVVGIYSECSKEVIFGEILTGRDSDVSNITDMIGPTLATVPTRIHIDQEESITQFLERVQSLSAEAIPYQYTGLQNIKHLSNDAAIACRFQNLLAIHHDTKEVSDGFWKLVSTGTAGTNFYSYPLTLSCQVSEGKVEIDAHYDQR